MPTYEITSPDGQVFEVNAPEGATEQDVMAYAKSEFAKMSTDAAVEQPQQEPNTIKRQLGLTARHLIEGTGELVGIASDPVAMLMRKGGLPVKNAGEVAKSMSDSIGLPTPQNPTERIVGTGSKMLVGTGGMMKTAASTGSNAIAKALTANPSLQAASAIGSGTAGATAKEMGGDAKTQFAASVAGGVLAPLTMAGAQKIITSLKNLAVKPNQIQIDNALKQAGIEIETIPRASLEAIRKDVKSALSTDDAISPEALRRLADYRLINATPTKGSLTLKPADVTRDRNLMKVGANSSDPAAQELANVANRNNQTLIGKLNQLGAENADDAITAGEKIMSSLKQTDAVAKNRINSLYETAKATNGRSARIDPRAFTQKANDLLDDALLGGKLPADVRNKLNSIAKGDTPLTVDVAEQFKTNLGNLQRASIDKAEQLAIGKVREALDDAPFIDIDGKDATNAFNQARSANRSYMQVVENTPALKSVRDGIEPDKFVQQFIVGNGAKANLSDLNALRNAVKNNPEALQTVKEQIMSHLKGKAVNNAADEVANFSPSNFNKTLKTIGDQKLHMFFSKEEVDLLKAVGRVASYEKFQPTGSAVNNSNTASAVSGLLDWISNNSVIRKIPFGSELVSNPATSIATGSGARQSLNASKGIISQQAKQPKQKMIPNALLLAPSLAVE